MPEKCKAVKNENAARVSRRGEQTKREGYRFPANAGAPKSPNQPDRLKPKSFCWMHLNFLSEDLVHLFVS